MAATKHHLACLVLVLAVTSCARMAVPPGGPEDKIAPEIVSTIPEQNSVMVPLDADVTLEFSEPVNRAAVEASLYLSPEPGRRLRYRWSGRRLTLDYLDPLPENRTIVVTVGATAKDLQNNPFENSYTLAFSTGDHIDKGEIAGAVALPPGVRSMAVTAYQVKDSLPDPMTDAPDYRMQTAPDGTFELGYLAPGTYRLFALDDKNFDGMWQPASEWIGTATNDVKVEEGTKPRITFAPSLQDTTPPAILRVRQMDMHRIDLRVNIDGQPRVNISDGSRNVPAEHFREDSTASHAWHIYFADTVGGDSALLRVSIGDVELSSQYAVKNRPDTTAPAFFESSPFNREMTRGIPREAIVIFSEPVVYSPDSDTAAVSLRADTNDVDITVEQTDPISLTITPSDSLERGLKYSLFVPQKLIQDYSGNILRDSLLKIAWYTFPEDSLGAIDGLVRATEMGPWIVELYPLKSSEPAEIVYTNTHFKFNGFPAGDYRLRVIRDANSNDRIDTGSMNPFRFSEPFQWHPDTISIRPRWTTEVEFLWTNVTQK